jgi:hypothetical protein
MIGNYIDRRLRPGGQIILRRHLRQRWNWKRQPQHRGTGAGQLQIRRDPVGQIPEPGEIARIICRRFRALGSARFARIGFIVEFGRIDLAADVFGERQPCGGLIRCPGPAGIAHTIADGKTGYDFSIHAVGKIDGALPAFAREQRLESFRRVSWWRRIAIVEIDRVRRGAAITNI